MPIKPLTETRKVGLSMPGVARRPNGARIYSCFDFRLRSAFPLDELTPAEDAADPRPVVDVRLGLLPEVLPGGRMTDCGLQIADGAVMLTEKGVARYLVDSGHEIVVDPFPGAPQRNIRLYLLGSALGILCHQRGLLPLHANAIVAGGAAVAFAGPSGVGKSTLAAHFQRAGYEVLCDDVCMIRFDAAGQPFAWPGLPRLKLWGDAAKAFGIDHHGFEPVYEEMDKYNVPLRQAGGQPAVARPIPFRRLYVLSRADDGGAGAIVQLRGQRAMEAVMAQTYRGLYLDSMGLRGRHFRHCAALLAHADVYAATRAWGYDEFASEADRLERHVAGAD
jgi:hypothetical protein